MAKKLDPAQAAGGEGVSVENGDPILVDQASPLGMLPRDHPDRVAARECRARTERMLWFRDAADRLQSPEEYRRGDRHLLRVARRSGGRAL